jgi:hypothetical protein
MNAELRAYIEAVASDCPKKKAAKPSLAGTLKSVVREWLASGDGYYCDLRYNKEMKAALARCYRHHDSIGFHGLA